MESNLVNLRRPFSHKYVFSLENMTIVYPSALEASSRSDPVENTLNKKIPTLNPFRMTKKGHQLGKSYSVMTALLPEEEPYPSPLHYNEKWEQEYDEFLEKQKSENKWRDPERVQISLNRYVLNIDQSWNYYSYS